jgi:type I restriction enzyme S subunit
MASSLNLKFGDLATVGSGYAFSSKSWISEGIPVVKIRNVQDGFVDMSECSFVSEDIAEKAQKWWTREGDTLVALTGAGVGEIGRMHKGQEALVNQRVGLVKPKDPSESDYVFYLLRHNKQRIIELASGSAQPNLAPSSICEIECQVAEPQKRVLIGQTLANLDLKIQINQQIASTLEQIAQTIFKSWFVDFDPVHAKSRGEQPLGIDAETASLFPDSFEDSELGPIPSGWKLGALGDFVQVIDCLHSKKPELLESGRPYLQLDTITDSGVLATERAALISDSDYIKWISRIEVTSGDCVITNVGRVGAVSQIPENFKAAIGRNITALRPNSVNVSRTYLIELLLSRFMRKEIEFRTDSGTILDALNVKNIPSLRAVLPDNACMQKFEEVAGPLRLQMNALHAQNVALAEVRDSLLPRLISGELEIPAELLEA